MADTIPSDKDVSTMKKSYAEATQVVLGSTENGVGTNGSTNGNGVTHHENPTSANGAAATATSDNEPIAGTSSGEIKSMETVNLAMQHLAAGKRDLLICDPNAAVASLALACELLGTHYGETAFECGEAYYYYGKALLDLARLEAGVIENLDGDEGNRIFKDFSISKITLSVPLEYFKMCVTFYRVSGK